MTHSLLDEEGTHTHNNRVYSSRVYGIFFFVLKVVVHYVCYSPFSRGFKDTAYPLVAKEPGQLAMTRIFVFPSQ